MTNFVCVNHKPLIANDFHQINTLHMGGRICSNKARLQSTSSISALLVPPFVIWAHACATRGCIRVGASKIIVVSLRRINIETQCKHKHGQHGVVHTLAHLEYRARLQSIKTSTPHRVPFLIYDRLMGSSSSQNGCGQNDRQYVLYKETIKTVKTLNQSIMMWSESMTNGAAHTDQAKWYNRNPIQIKRKI